MTEQAASFSIPSSYSRIVARELNLQEKDLPQLLRGTGLPVDILLPGDETRMTGQQQVQVLVNARQMGESPEFGLRLGRQLQPSAHGPIGYLALASPDLFTALKSLRDFLPIRIPFAQLELGSEGEWLCCSLQIKLRLQPSELRMLLECFALVIQELVETFIGHPLLDARIHFDFPAPPYRDVYPQYLHSPIEFGAPRNGVLLPADLALIANASSDPEAFAVNQQLCRNLLDKAPTAALSMTDRVRRLLLSQPAGTVSEEDVARALFVSKRTLARRLGRENTHYRAVRDDILAQLAAHHLRDNRLTVEAVAALLGYHDSANFRRAFKRWTGQTPSSFREKAL